jgi:hypothetical protein
MIVLAGACNAFAGTRYEIKSKAGEESITYTVDFGGGRGVDQFTAFDPVSKKFVYFYWKRTEKEPQPVGKVWSHTTGETLKLYKFPGVECPLPVIPSIEDMKVCPITGDKNFKFKAIAAID